MSVATSRTEVVQRSRRWGWAHAFAIVGIPLLLWEGWTIIAWLADDPHQITQFRDRESTSWYVAHALEAVLAVVALAVLVYLVRGCLRSRRIFTFDVIFCLCTMATINSDVGPNVVQPTLLFNSNFVNLNNMNGHMPFVVNPDAGRVPDPILFNFLLATFGYLALSMIATVVVAKARRRWPGISIAKLVGLLIGCGLVLALVLEPLFAIPLHLWNWAPMPVSIPIVGGSRFPLLEVVAAGLAFGLIVSIRVLKDDRGLTVVERGFERQQPWARTGLTMLACYGLIQLIVWIPGTMPMGALTFYQQQWDKMPNYVVNDACNAPGVTETRYGPCPGSPGFRMPVRGSLPGESP